jgi:hypothetical protein
VRRRYAAIVASAVLPLILAAPAFAQATFDVRGNVCIDGGNYSNFTLDNTNDRHTTCQSRCAAAAHCKGYTYVRPGFQGPYGRCWLKVNVARTVNGPGCVSGFKTGAADRPRAGIPAFCANPSTGQPRASLRLFNYTGVALEVRVGGAHVGYAPPIRRGNPGTTFANKLDIGRTTVTVIDHATPGRRARNFDAVVLNRGESTCYDIRAFSVQ